MKLLAFSGTLCWIGFLFIACPFLCAEDAQGKDVLRLIIIESSIGETKTLTLILKDCKGVTIKMDGGASKNVDMTETSAHIRWHSVKKYLVKVRMDDELTKKLKTGVVIESSHGKEQLRITVWVPTGKDWIILKERHEWIQ